MDNLYNENSIKILEGLEAVRKRPGMYIGSTDKRGLHHLVWEIVDNGIDEVINGYGNHLKIILHKDKSVSVTDTGRGLPVGMHASGKSTPEVIYTVLHAGGKFEEGGYKVSGGLHGVGASVVNALSTSLEVYTRKDGFEYYIKFVNGGNLDTPLTKLKSTSKTGTTVRFIPDDTIFSTTNFNYSTICERMQESAFLIDNLTVEIIDEINDKKEKFFYDNGLKSFVEFINEENNTLHDVVTINGMKEDINVNVAFQYTDTYTENVISFVNNVKTTDGGTHEVGFKSAITKVFNEYAKQIGVIKAKDKNFEGTDVREGLTAIISLQIPEKLLQFEGQTKAKLGTSQARSVVESLVIEKIMFFLQENKAVATSIIDKAVKGKLAREAARKAREETRKGKNSNKIEKLISSKLTPAQSKDKSKNEIFLVEGDSAGGSAKRGRNYRHQAILPLKGKVLNAQKNSLADVLGNSEINTIIHTLGADFGADFDVKKLAYNKVIIMTDADDDGAHIQILILTFFYRYMKPLIEGGFLYIACPPLYKIYKGKKVDYAWSEEEKADLLKKMPGANVDRFKGLGEMNPELLWNTTMNPDTRNLIKVEINDAALAEKRVSVLMGENVEPRKKWIEDNIDFSIEDSFEIE